MIRLSIAMLAVFVLTGIASAEPAKVDWARGLVIASGRRRRRPARTKPGGGPRYVAPRRAGRRRRSSSRPSSTICRSRAAARSAIARRTRTSPSGSRARSTPRSPIAAEPETDGAWQVTMAVPLEAVRQAARRARVLPADGDKGPIAVVVTGATAKPAIGWKVGTLEAPTLFVTDVPAWAKDAPRATAKSAKAGVIEVGGIDAHRSDVVRDRHAAVNRVPRRRNRVG